MADRNHRTTSSAPLVTFAMQIIEVQGFLFSKVCYRVVKGGGPRREGGSLIFPIKLGLKTSQSNNNSLVNDFLVHLRNPVGVFFGWYV